MWRVAVAFFVFFVELPTYVARGAGLQGTSLQAGEVGRLFRSFDPSDASATRGEEMRRMDPIPEASCRGVLAGDPGEWRVVQPGDPDGRMVGVVLAILWPCGRVSLHPIYPMPYQIYQGGI